MENFHKLSPEEQRAFLLRPAMKVPPGVTQNLTDPPNRNHFALIVTIICLVICSLCFFIRVYARVFVVRRVKVEDGEWINPLLTRRDAHKDPVLGLITVVS
jgi:hypothetical protein